MKAWTDYPFPELGDTPGREAPVREITVLSCDGNKYCRIAVDDVESEIKAGYIYARPGRYGEVEVISIAIMTMIESADGKISWECSECGALLKDRKGFETKTARCPKCGTVVVEFVGLYEDE